MTEALLDMPIVEEAEAAEAPPVLMRGERVKRTIARVCKEYELPVSRVFSHHKNTGQEREMLVTAARWKIIWVLKNSEADMSWGRLGRILGMDHTSCWYAYQRMNETNGEYWTTKLENRNPTSKRLSRQRNARVLKELENRK